MHEPPAPPAPPGAVDDRPVDPPVDRPVDRWIRRFVALDGVALAAVAVEALVLVGTTVFVLAQLGPSLLVANTTPAGGDMGAHVWGPAYLRDHLLPSGRLAGWTPDWYAGFPAYHFYMVVPALLIVALDAGWEGWAALVPLAAALGLLAVSLLHRAQRIRRLALVAAVAVALLGCGLPYGVAFKWVTVAGVVALPLACYVAARLADLPFPGPPLAAIAAVVFLFNREPTLNGTGNIIGGNMTSTLAGEFSFSLSLLCCVLYLGFLLRGLRTGGYRATTAVLLGLTALCHVIPAIFAAGVTVVAVLVSLPLDRRRLRWLLPIGPVAVAISAFWTLPFAARRAYLNDMGWEKIPSGITEIPLRDFLWSVWTQDRYDEFRGTFIDVVAPTSLWWVMALAAVGAVVSVVLRIRVGVLLALCSLGTLVAFVVAPQGRLWNARILPFYVLSLCLLAALAVAEVGRAVASLVTRHPERKIWPLSVATPVVAGVAALVVVALPLGVLPGSERTAEGAERWLGFERRGDELNPARDWARWNYTGYERKDAFPEYHGLIAMGERIAADDDLGCGRVMWEYENDRLNRYGTPMAPMLLPFWTDGCIGSMEGLYFEASATTPYHFLNQRALSANCSCAQRDLPYPGGFDIDLGVQQLQQMGVRYYFAFSDVAVEAASAHPDLTEVDSSEDGVWHAYIVDGSELVEPLEHQPAVVTGVEPGMSWVGVASKWWQDPSRWDVVLADEVGPDEWERIEARYAPVPPKPAGAETVVEAPDWTRIDVSREPERVELPEIEVTDLVDDRDGIAFDVSEVGVPVLVKMSYFPNWQVSGADGPYRVTPNHMVVVPTDTHVELSYGWTGVDIGSYALSSAGVVGAVLLARQPMRRREDEGDVWLDGPDPIAATGPPGLDGLDGLDGDLRPMYGPPAPGGPPTPPASGFVPPDLPEP